MDEIALVEIENLSYAYPADDERAPALDRIDLTVAAGEFVLLAGGSGSGKSTLLRAIAALVPHFYGGSFSGVVRVNGRDTKTIKPAELAGTVGFVFQDPEAQLIANGVEAEVAFGLENMGLSPGETTRRVEETLVAMGISPLRTSPIGELSGGQQQKTALAAVLAMQPELLILDEPTSQLDPVAAEGLLASLRRLNEETGATIILAEHRLDRCYHWADRVVAMDSGRIVCDDEPRAAAGWALAGRMRFVPPVCEVFEGRANGNLPLTVKEGRALLAASEAQEAPPRPLGRRGGIRDPGASLGRAGEIGDRAIDVRDLHFSYPNGTEALRGCDLTVSCGEFVAIMGENGAGKSTLARHLNGLLRSARGRVEILGRDIRGAATEELARDCALVGQNPNDYLFSDTVRDELAFTLSNVVRDTGAISSAGAPRGAGPAPGTRDERIDVTLAELGLSDTAEANPRSLSAGQRQRVALASVLVADPRVVVLDEPTRGMDWAAKDGLGRILRGLQGRGVAVVVITHDVEFAANHADRVVLMGQGRVIADGPKHEVMDGAIFLAPQVNKLMRGTAPRVLTVAEARGVLEAMHP